MKRKILVTGGEGRFAKVLKSKNKKLNLIFVNKKYCNILDEYSLEKCIKKFQIKIISRQDKKNLKQILIFTRISQKNCIVELTKDSCEN